MLGCLNVFLLILYSYPLVCRASVIRHMIKKVTLGNFAVRQPLATVQPLLNVWHGPTCQHSAMAGCVIRKCAFPF